VQQRVKARFLDEAVRDDSRLWIGNDDKKQDVNGASSLRVAIQKPQQDGSGVTARLVNSYHGPLDATAATQNHVNVGVNDSLLDGDDPLDDLYLQGPTRYWPSLPPEVISAVDPFALARNELSALAHSIRGDLIGTDHPVLHQAASYFFQTTADGGKKIRPLMVLLISRALSETVGASGPALPAELTQNDAPALFASPLPWQRGDLPSAQRRLAEISEMIHTASLFHDDVIDGSDTRRGMPSAHKVFGNKTAILAGDYLLARASICLARLRHVHVVETMSTIIEHLVRGEVMQMRGNVGSRGNDGSSEASASDLDSGCTQRLQYYLRKNFYKTASLMANSCKSAALLGNYPPDLVLASYRYGKHVGMAFQLVDDSLDFEGTLSQLGKPSLADLKAGLATAPVLFAAQEFSELYPLMDRKFREDGDVERAVELVFASKGLERTKDLARAHAEVAMDSILALKASDHRDSLVLLANTVVARTK
jgi:geranylgeranyl pyrophosphate synthase